MCPVRGHTSHLIMQSDLRNSLLAPIKTLTYCVTGEKTQSNRTNRRFTSGSKGKSCAPSVTRRQDAHLPLSYQAELERERKLRVALNAQKNAERAAMRTHFRRKYELSENVKDTDHVRAVGGKVSLPAELAKMVYPQAPVKDDSFSLLSAFQGLRFTGGIYTDNQQTKPATDRVNSCDVYNTQHSKFTLTHC